MFKRQWEYVVMVSKSWGRAISGPVLAVVGLALGVLQLTIKDEPTAAFALKCGAWVTLSIAALMILVAQYDVWKQEREKVEELRSDLPRFEVAIEQMSTGNIYGSIDMVNFSNFTYAAPVVRILNLGAQSVVTSISFKILKPDGSIIEGQPMMPPTEIVQTDAHGRNTTVPFGEWFADFNIKPILKGTIARGRLFIVYPDLTQAMIGGQGFKYEIRIRDAWHPQTPEYVSVAEWNTADAALKTFPGMGVKAKMIDPIKLD